MPDADLPESLSLEQAFSAALFMVEIYGDIEHWKSKDIFLYYDYMRSDPARWGDWQEAIRRALANPEAAFEWMVTWPREGQNLADDSDS